MADAIKLAQLGIFLEHNFLDEGVCLRIRDAIRIASGEEPGSRNLPNGLRSAPDYPISGLAREPVNPKVALVTALAGEPVNARVTLAKVPDVVVREMTGNLRSLLPRLEAHYHKELRDCSIPSFLLYKPGDYLPAHPDSHHDPNLPEEIRKRRVSVVVFLNSQSDQPVPGTYDGGYLTFHMMKEHQDWPTRRLNLSGERGMLVAFPSTSIHEVTPITRGERFTVVSWFYANQ
jgi:SM-20-related protein